MATKEFEAAQRLAEQLSLEVPDDIHIPTVTNALIKAHITTIDDARSWLRVSTIQAHGNRAGAPRRARS
jgi:hypothetical protein